MRFDRKIADSGRWLGQPRAIRREPTTLVIGQSKAPVTELLLQGAILFDDILDDLGLMAVDPAGEGGEEELKWEEFGHCTRIVR